jgi:hypothetical protein
LLLCNDRAVLGPWVNPRWLNVVGCAIVGALVMLSLILVVTTLFPEVDGTLVAEVLGGATLATLIGIGLAQFRRPRSPQSDRTGQSELVRETWRMPPLALLSRPEWSTTRTLGMLALRGYLALAVLLLIVKVVQVALGQ